MEGRLVRGKRGLKRPVPTDDAMTSVHPDSYPAALRKRISILNACEDRVIIDTLDHLQHYAGTEKYLPDIDAFLKQTDPYRLPEGRLELRGDALSATVVKRQGIALKDAVLEAHRRFTDLHLVLAGTELIGWCPVEQCATPSVPYDAARDIVFFSDVPRMTIVLTRGMFALFSPDDAHAPLISDGFIHKVIFKLSVEERV